MLIRLWVAAMLCLAGVAIGAEAPEGLTAAVDKIADSGSYSWHAVTNTGLDNGRTTEDGQSEKSGWTFLKTNVGDGVVRIIMKDRAAVINAGSGWKSADDLADTRGGARVISSITRGFKAPLALAKQLLAQVGDIKQEGDSWVAEATGDDAAGLVRGVPAFRMGRNTLNPKVTVTFSVQGGVLNRIEIRSTGSAGRAGSETPFVRSYTVEFSSVGTTTVEVPDEVKKKLE